jgi:hypothetical protein
MCVKTKCKKVERGERGEEQCGRFLTMDGFIFDGVKGEHSITPLPLALPAGIPFPR